MERDDLLEARDVALEVAHVDRLGALDERDEDVQAGARDAVEAAEALDDHHLGLTDDPHALGDDDDAQGGDDADERS